MGSRERGIGNFPFIAVLVLFVIALALFFLKQDEADRFRKDAADQLAQKRQAQTATVAARAAYEAAIAVTGVADERLVVKGDEFPAEGVVNTALRDALWTLVEQMQGQSQFQMDKKEYGGPPANLQIVETAGDTLTVRIFSTTLSKDNATFLGILQPIPAQLASAGKIAAENNQKFMEALNTYRAQVTALNKSNSDNKDSYASDVAAKTSQADQLRNDLQSTRDTVTNQTAQIDALQTQTSTIKQESERAIRVISRERDAWKTRAINEKTRKELALAEDPKDGEILVASKTRATVFINRGRKHRVSLGTRFTVWRPGKGNLRQDAAVIQVIRVMPSSSEARVIKVLNRRLPLAQGMNISNPFYDAHRTLRAFIYGDLRNYTTSIARRQLAKAGVEVVTHLDENVDVIILGEPPVTVTEEVDDEGAAKSAELNQRVQRSKRLNDIMEKAVAVGAIVVTEEVLRTFVEY